jgi:hypothetical protein
MNVVVAVMVTLYDAYDMYSWQAWMMCLPGLLVIVFLLAVYIALKYYAKRTTATTNLDEAIRDHCLVLVDFKQWKFLGEYNDERYGDFVDDPRYAFKWVSKRNAKAVCEELKRSRGWELKPITIIEAMAIWQDKRQQEGTK